MKVYIVQNENEIEPFLENAKDVLIGNEKLSIIQKKAFSKLNLVPIQINDINKISDADEHLVLGEEIYFSADLLKEFINKSRKLNCETVCAVKKGIFTLRTFVNTQEIKSSNDYIEYNLRYYPTKNKKGEPQIVIFDLDQSLENVPMPKHISSDGKYLIPLIDKPIIQINHWSNLWAANLMSILSNMARLQKTNKIKLFIKALKNFSFNKWKIASSLNKIGKNCDIHPTAYIEGSIIGDNVIIGAGTVIRESNIGDNSLIGNGVIIETSVVGDNCTILNGHVLYSVLFPNTLSVTHMISTSIIGKNCFIGSGAVLTDFRFDNKTIAVVKNNKKIDTENTFLGCCLGNNVYFGAGCVIAPGRALPNNTRISLSEERIITNISNENKNQGFRITP